MYVFRVCSQQEARAQVVGKLYQRSRAARPVVSTQPGFHATRVPEHWRRILNHHMQQQGLGGRFTHTLLLEIPDGTPAVNDLPLPGIEYRLEDASQVIVRGIAGPAWPVPEWVPQPLQETEWDPTSTR